MNSIAKITILIVGAASLGACVIGAPYYQPDPSGYAPPPNPDADYAASGYGDSGGYDGAGYDEPQIIVRAAIAPPPLPYYQQPPCPDAGMLWTPGYWAYGPEGYFWVPGTWVYPPRVGLLWTPGYWGWSTGAFIYHSGYWGARVGFYGGIHYGGGYDGEGFVGGRWIGNDFAYNRAVTNVNVNVISNTYNETVVNNVVVNRVSYNGGRDGVRAAPTPQDRLAARDPHIARTRIQMEHLRDASVDRAQLLRVNRGRPAVLATPRPQAMPQFRQRQIQDVRLMRQGQPMSPESRPMPAGRPLQQGRPLPEGRPVPQQGRPMEQGRPVPQQGRPMEQGRPMQERRAIQQGRPPQERQPPRQEKPRDNKAKRQEQSKGRERPYR